MAKELRMIDAAGLQDSTPENAAYVLLIEGREHNVFVEKITDIYVVGRVALNKTVMLVSQPAKHRTIAKLVDQNASGAVGPGEELLMSEECVTPSKTLKIRVRISSVDIIEDPWRPLLPSEAVGVDDIVEPKALCDAMPAFKSHYVEGQGFVCSPAAWEKAVPSKKGESQDIPFELVEGNKNSSSSE